MGKEGDTLRYGTTVYFNRNHYSVVCSEMGKGKDEIMNDYMFRLSGLDWIGLEWFGNERGGEVMNFFFSYVLV